jgi:hypothetical protein
MLQTCILTGEMRQENQMIRKKFSGKNNFPQLEKPHMEKIIEQRDGKKTRRKTYPEYLVKWKDHLVEDSSWVTEPDILKHGKTVQELMDKSP